MCKLFTKRENIVKFKAAWRFIFIKLFKLFLAEYLLNNNLKMQCSQIFVPNGSG